jgi:Yip1-like protein
MATAVSSDSGSTPMSEFSRVLGVFFEPKKTFGDIAQRPRWLVPMLISIVSGFLLIYLFSTHVGWEPMLRRAFDLSPRVQQLTPEQRQNAFNLQLRIVPTVAYVAAVLGPALMYLIGGGVILGIVRALLGVPLRFAQVFATMAYASLPRVIFVALSIVVMFLKNPEDFDIQNSFASNPGAFMDPQTSSRFLYTLASSLDVFTIWVILLIATGLKAAGGKRISFGGALFAAGLPWAVYVVIRGALAAAGLGG